MMDAEQILQERLERLEAGERLDTILTHVPDEESDLLFLAAQIRAIPKPARNAAIIQQQHTKVVRAARQHLRGTSRAAPNPWSLRWLIPAGVTLIIITAIAGFWAGMNGFNRPAPDSGISSHPDGTQTAPVSGGTPIVGQLPTLTSPASPQTAVLSSLHGIVQIQNEQGDWLSVEAVELKAGQTFRTWLLSSAQLVFFDGSTVTMGPNTQLTLETLHTSTEGPRQISLFQTSGETQHHVAPSPETSSSYIVRTPQGRGEAKGTVFQVFVTGAQTSSFAVLEGQVAVTGLQTTVTVSPGQITDVRQDAVPLDPVVWLHWEGEVTETGLIWIIGGEVFQVKEQTFVSGSPKPGDMVTVRGRLLSDGTQVADRIELQTPALINRFNMLGEIEEMGVLLWTISGKEIRVNEQTQIHPQLEIGSKVLVHGVVQEGGGLLGTQLQLVDATSPFEITGLVEQVAAQTWKISGTVLSVDEHTDMIGEAGPGNLVHVTGQVLPDGRWLAHRVETVTEIFPFEFAGMVATMTPWQVNGISLTTNAQTQISPSLEPGAFVRVKGRLLENGTWLANEILLLDDEPGMLVYVGIVDNLAPWTINGIPLVVTEDTVMTGEVALASLVRVYAQMSVDGPWQARRIEVLDLGPVAGCIEFVSMVISFNDLDIILQNGITLARTDTQMIGVLEVGREGVVRMCFGPDGTLIFASLRVVEPVGSESTPVPDPISGDKVTICHIPGGNAQNAQTITVDASAVDAHLKHGDYLGPCQGNSGNENKDNKEDKGPKNDKDDKGNGNNK